MRKSLMCLLAITERTVSRGLGGATQCPEYRTSWLKMSVESDTEQQSSVFHPLSLLDISFPSVAGPFIPWTSVVLSDRSLS